MKKHNFLPVRSLRSDDENIPFSSSIKEEGLPFFIAVRSNLLFMLIMIPWVLPAHPTGNMVVLKDAVLWSYVYPIEDREHHACVMIWDRKSPPRPFMVSDHPASDFMLSNNDDTLYIIERRLIQSSNHFEVRLLKTTLPDSPRPIWPWFEDNWRIGEGGFFMLSDDEVVFARYPALLKMKKGQEPAPYLQFDPAINKVRPVANERLLLLSDDHCWLIDWKGEVIRQWSNIIDGTIQNAPLNRNSVFDADYHQGKLLLAYWGNRSFELIDKTGQREVLIQQKEPLVPHWVAFDGEKKLLFSSVMVFDGSNPKPFLLQKDQEVWNIWVR